MAVEEKVFNSLDRYYSTLSITGYAKQKDINKLLVFNFIRNFLQEDTGYYITEDDYKSINNALNCIYGSTCLIPYPEYKKSISSIGYRMNPVIRYTESNIVRFTEDNIRDKDNS